MELEAQLESKIINQLAHKIGPEKLKDSSIRMKKTPNWVSVTLWSVFIFILISCTLYLKSYVVITKIVSKDEVLNIIKNIMTTSRLFVAVVCAEAVCVFVTIWYIVNAQIKHRFFRKVCIKDNEIELFEEEGKESYFDKYMDEIKYMLCKAEEDIIVFEDIDRYDSRLIFQKLREINMICNHNTKKIIRFIYLIRDDMFEQKDRTKFFDFIIPILPVVNCANSYEIFMTLFEGTELEKERRFFKQLSLYVDEMRLVNNIYNEFLIYEKNLRKISVGKTKKKIFALVVYKNIFPSDYILLQNNRGFIAEVFHVKEQCVNSRVTVAKVDFDKKHFYFVAINDVNQYGKPVNQAYNNVETAFDGLFKAINSIGHYDDLAMPLIGTGKAAIREATIENVVEDTINRFVCADDKIARKLIICIRPKDYLEGRADFSKIVKYLDYKSEFV